MIDKALIRVSRVADTLLAGIDTRQVALWIRDLPARPAAQGPLLAFLSLPWRVVLSEAYEATVFDALESEGDSSTPMTRKRGFVQVIDQDPSRIDLPERCLPCYLLNGKTTAAPSADFTSQLRRLTMLEALRRSGASQLLIVSINAVPVPSELSDLWSSGFRPHLTFLAERTASGQTILEWLRVTPGVAAANLVTASAVEVIDDVLARYAQVYPEKRRILRVRDTQGTTQRVDVTEADEPERPILQFYSLVEERDLTPLMPTDLSEDDFNGFFRNPEASWRPYAAGLPWQRAQDTLRDLLGHLKKLDSVGSDNNPIAYITCESGAGGTTLARVLAWECARQGYPVLIAQPLPFVPDALSVTNFIKRINDTLQRARPDNALIPGESGAPAVQEETVVRHYEAPWLIVFDTMHWQYREAELIRFRNEFKESGRPVCILLVTGTVLGLPFYTNAIFKKLAELSHAIDKEDSLKLGRHLNRFLRVYNKEKSNSEWDRFYEDHTVRYLEGTAAFWVTLSFWIQGQFDLSESIQQWMYRAFESNTSDNAIRAAILEIAALSSERLPLPESLLTPSANEWPISQLLEDARSELAALGLTRISSDGERHWALIHDILGRFLINALFYDHAMRVELGFDDAKDAEHLRFLLLQRISRKTALGERHYRPLGEEFATKIFKIDPGHGHGSFVALWREVLASLDDMPRSLMDTSRIFRHHTAISRRRIAKLDARFYGVTAADKLSLLKRAVDDINYAISFIEYSPGSESNLNLFNSLANAYFDLAKVEGESGASRERITELRRLASEATRRAYEENPTSSFVIETYVKDLLQAAKHSEGETAVDQCVEALGILFSALAATEGRYRASQLGSLADEALELLFGQDKGGETTNEPKDATQVLVNAWRILAEDGGSWSEAGLAQVSTTSQLRALGVLDHPAGRGNMLVLRLTFDLMCLAHPLGFQKQLELVEQLQRTNYRLAPQLRLEYAILLFQTGRAAEGEKIFRSLRRLWRESEHFVHVPDRLRWLRSVESAALKTVRAIVGSDYGNRAMARVQEFRNALVPFRPEEHGLREAKPGKLFACHVSFGHNGPFLRPLTAAPSRFRGE